MLQKTISISSASILALNGTPLQVVGAPGPNLALVPIASYFSFKYGTTPYAGGSDVSLYSGPPANGVVWGVAAAQSTVQLSLNADEPADLLKNAFTAAVAANAENQPINLSASVAFTGGDGTVVFTLFYTIAPTT